MDLRCEAGPASSFCTDDTTIGSCEGGVYGSETCGDGYVCSETDDENAVCVAEDTDGDGTADSIDCDATDPAVYPGADEVCDGIDNDCDGIVDEDAALDASTWYADVDGDVFGTP